jgi:tRNA (adenine57-N1/adenine58-N1)-methyltransferase catalytic subunit
MPIRDLDHQEVEHVRVASAGDRVMLLSPRGKRFFVNLRPGERLHTHRGMVEHDAIIGTPYGASVRSHLNEILYVMRPSIHDELMAIRRASQIIYPKELGLILLKLSLRAGSRVIEAGTGSGAMTIALAHAVQPDGRVYSYDVRSDMLALAKHNLTQVGLLDRVELVERDISEGFVHEQVDALFLDVREPWEHLGAASRALADDGYLGMLVPTTNQIVATLEALEGLAFVDIEVLEILLRYYRAVPGRLRPDDTMVGHTGYLLFARKILRASAASRAAATQDIGVPEKDTP